MYLDEIEIKSKAQQLDLFNEKNDNIITESFEIENQKIPKYIGEFWTSKQRKAKSIHEISYRACFKPQLPNFFINSFTEKGDIVYDPFSGRGTTIIEAALLQREVIGNDINPLSKIFIEGRLNIPDINEFYHYLKNLKLNKNLKADIDLSMFYHPDTESEIVSLRNYILSKENNHELNHFDKWIRMVATNRLTGHSKGFLSTYTLPPNQAVSPEQQKKINKLKKQTPEYRNLKEIVFLKTKSLLRNLNKEDINNLKNSYKHAILLSNDARYTVEIPSNYINLIVTSPPFLDVVQYSKDNWLRAWFNGIDIFEIDKKITVLRKIDDWVNFMKSVFEEFFRILKSNGTIAFEVGEVRNGKINLDEYIIPIALNTGFQPIGIMINTQKFTKTSNIWGIKNNKKGTNTNRIIILKKS